MSVFALQRMYNTVRAGAKCLMSPKVYLPNQTRILSINLRKDVYLGAIEKVDKMVRVRDKFLLTTYPKIVSVADGPLVGSVLNNVDDIFNFLF